MQGVLFERFRFARALAGLEISSPYFSAVGDWFKYAVNSSAVFGVDMHLVFEGCGVGTMATASMKFAYANHYRHPTVKQLNGDEIVSKRDDLLLAEVANLEEALKKRYGVEWQKFLDRMKTAPEPNMTACPEIGMHGPPVWKEGQVY